MECWIPACAGMTAFKMAGGSFIIINALMRLGTIIHCVMGLAFIGAVVCWISLIGLRGRSFYGEFFLAVSLIVMGCSITALPCAKCLERGRWRLLMWAGLTASAVCALGWTGVLWIGFTTWADPDRTIIVTLGTTSVFAGWVMIAATMIVCRLTSTLARVVRGVTIVIASLLAFLIAVVIWDPNSIDRHEEEFARTVAIFAVLTLSGMALTIILARLKQLTTGSEEAEEVVRMDFSVWCPRCELHQSIQTGGARCSRCGLDIKVSMP